MTMKIKKSLRFVLGLPGSRRLLLLLLCVLPLGLFLAMLTGCNDFERTSFQSLSASKALIDQAQTDYELHTLPQSAVSYRAIGKAKEAQRAAVDALLAYEAIKSAKGSAAALQAQQQIVLVALAQLAPLLADIRAFGSRVSRPSVASPPWVYTPGVPLSAS